MRSTTIDLRLALPVGIAWASLALVIGISGAHVQDSMTVNLAPAVHILQPVTDFLATIRSSFVAVLRGWPAPGSELVAGLAVGDTSLVSTELNTAMKAASLTHLTAVSGANCAIITSLILRVAAATGLGRRLRVLIAAVALVVFVLLVTPQPSVLRAATMGAVMLIAEVRGSGWAGVPVLALASYLLLMLVPSFAVAPGFALSVAATAGLLLLSRPLGVALSRWFPEKWARVLAIPLAAQIACQPILVLLTPQLQTYGVLANLLAEPVIAAATVCGLIAVVLLPWAPILAWPFIAVAWAAGQWIAAIAFGAQALPLASLPWVGGWWGFGFTLLCCTATVYALLGRRPVLCILARMLVLVSLGVTLIAASTLSIWAGLSRPQNWSIYMCDIGQGDAVLLAGNDSEGKRHIALIDTGRDVTKLKGCLSDARVDHLDMLVLTHYDQDHVGASPAVVGMVDTALVPTPENQEDRQRLAALARGGATLVHGWAGLAGSVGVWRYRVLWPMDGFPDFAQGNPGSITMLFGDGKHSALFLGDQNELSQQAFVAKYPRLQQIDIVKIAHHGSSDQDESAYALWRPAISLISVGRNNGYGHPTGKTLDMLRRHSTDIERTDLSGDVALTFVGEQMRIWRERGG